VRKILDTTADREFAAREIARVLAIAAFKIAQRRAVAEMSSDDVLRAGDSASDA